MGFLLAVVVTAANVTDTEGARCLALACSAFPRLHKFWRDGAYTGELQELYQKQRGIAFEIVEKPAGQKGFVVSPKRWVVERSFAWLGGYRGLSRDYEYCPRQSEGRIKVAQIHLMVRRLTRSAKS